MNGGVLGKAICLSGHSASDMSTMAVAVVILSGVIAVSSAHPAVAQGVKKLFMLRVDSLQVSNTLQQSCVHM